jgi:hypothetical protein
MAPNLPLPMGKASFQLEAGLSYHSLKCLSYSWAWDSRAVKMEISKESKLMTDNVVLDILF